MFPLEHLETEPKLWNGACFEALLLFFCVSAGYLVSVETLAQVSDTTHTHKHGSYRQYKSTPSDIYMQCYMQLNKEANIHINRTQL